MWGPGLALVAGLRSLPAVYLAVWRAALHRVVQRATWENIVWNYVSQAISGVPIA